VTPVLVASVQQTWARKEQRATENGISSVCGKYQDFLWAGEGHGWIQVASSDSERTNNLGPVIVATTTPGRSNQSCPTISKSELAAGKEGKATAAQNTVILSRSVILIVFDLVKSSNSNCKSVPSSLDSFSKTWKVDGKTTRRYFLDI
jgi:hypothetical protein